MFYYCLHFTEEETERAQGQTSITYNWRTWCEGRIVTLMCICITSDLITQPVRNLLFMSCMDIVSTQ